MKLSSVAKLGGVAAFAALVLAGCGSNSSQGGSSKTLNWTESANLPTMDLSKATDIVSGRMTNSTGEGLLRLAANNKVVPGVAKSYKVSKDGKTWTFNLRKSNWSNGKPVTAKDFVYSWQRTVNPKTASQYAYIFGNIVNANKVNTGKLPLSKLGVEAKGDYKLVVHLIKPQSFFKYMVAQTYYFPENKAAVQKNGSKYGTTSKALVYNGPFKMTNWNGTNDSWKLVKNNQYWNKSKVKLDAVNVQVIKDPSTALNSYQSNKIDFTTLNGTQVKQYKNNKEYHVNKEASTFYLEMNRKKDPIFKNANIRKALSYAIDRKQMADKVLADGSTAPKGYVPANMSKHNGKDFADAAYSKNGVSYNLAQANKYWAKGLKETGKKSVTWNLLSDDTDGAKKSTEFVQSQLEKLPGLKINNQNLPFKTRLSRSTDGNFDLVITAWIADYPDPSNFLDLMTSTNSQNNGKFKNAEYDKLVKDYGGKDANNETARWNDMVKAEKILMDQNAIIPLYQTGKSGLLKSRVSGFEYFPTSPEYGFENASVK